MADDYDEYDDDIGEAPASGIMPKPTPVTCIVEAAWRAAITDEVKDLLARDGQTVLVITVPDPTWVRPVEGRIQHLLGDGWKSFARDGSNRQRDRADMGGGEVATHIAGGHNVVGIAASSGILPNAIVSGADLTIEIERPDGRVVGEAIRRFLARKLASSKTPGAGSLDLFELAICFRRGSAKAIADRISRALEKRIVHNLDSIPDLASAVEFGAARDWGLAVARDVAEFNAGRLRWSDVECNVILYSAPGLGKTTFASSLARHMNATLIATSISEMFASSPGYLDSVIKALRETYRQAEASRPAIILFDEIDALPTRVGLDSRSASWWTSVITEMLLLTAVPRPHVIQIAATNFLDRVDPALRRPGRFGRAIELQSPGPDGVVSMIRFHLRGELPEADLSLVGQVAAGSTAAEIMALVRRARGAARTANRALAVGDLMDAVVGDAEVAPADLRRIAVHEAGHATVSLALGVDELIGLQVGGGDRGLGSTKHRRQSDLETRATIEKRVTMMLAGRAAELVCLTGISDGSNTDLVGATRVVAAIHGALGLGEMMIAVEREELDREIRLDPVLRHAVESDLRRLQDRAIEIIRKHRHAVEAMATALTGRRHLTGDEARRIFAACNPDDTPPLQPDEDLPEC